MSSLHSKAEETLEWAAATYPGQVVLAGSFGGPSGMVLLDMVARLQLPIPTYYLDTGLLFPQTYELIEKVRERYGIDPIAVEPELDLEAQAAQFGEALWARDPNKCCALRKVAPQRKFLSNYRAWITGLRRDQSPTRASIQIVEWDELSGGLFKISPLAEWTEEDVWAAIRMYDIPYNALHEEGYPSLGCIPCTRAVAPGDDMRAGRWAGFTKTECGLHARPTAEKNAT